MLDFSLIATNSIASTLYILSALIMVSVTITGKIHRKSVVSAALLVAFLGILKFLIYSYPLTSAWPGSRVFSAVIFISCGLTFLSLYFLTRGRTPGFQTPIFCLSAAVAVDCIEAIRPNIYLIVIECLLLAFSSFLLVSYAFQSRNVTRSYVEGVSVFGFLFGLGIFLVIHIETIHTRSIFSEAYGAVRTYQQVLADTEKRLLSDSKLLSLSLLNLPARKRLDGYHFLLWQKMLRANSISYVDRNGVVVSSSKQELKKRDLSYLKVVSSALRGTACASIQKSPLGSMPALIVSRPLFSKNYSIPGAIIIEASLEDIVGDDFKRNGLFFLNGRNELVFGKTNFDERLPGLVPSVFAGQNGKTGNNGTTFCIYGKGPFSDKEFCYDGNFFRLIALPLYRHNVNIAKIFSLHGILINRFELSLALFLSGTIYLLLLHKFIKNRFYSIRLQREISSRKEAEKRLKTLAVVVEQAVESIIITDPSGIIKYVNPFFTRLTGYKPEEVIGTKADFAQENETNAYAFKEIWKALIQAKSWSGRLSSRARNGKRLVEDCIIFPIKNRACNMEGIVAVKKDITREKELESLLLHAQKMESIGMLAGGIAHDFNNILAAIQINLDLIPLFDYDREKTKNYMEKIQYGVTRATDLVKQLLMFSRRKVLDREVVDLNQSIDNLLSMVESTIGEDIALHINREKNLWPMVADPGVVDQIIMNLVVNAKDAMPDGGKLSIGTSNVIMNKSGIDKKFVRLSIRDTGEGMKKEVLNQIFDPFFTTKEIGKGTGLGLSVVYGIVRQLGGFIDVNSEERKGTAFDIYFPAAPEATFGEKKQDEPFESPKGTGQRILLVEDEEAVRKVIREVLLENGYFVRCCSTIQEARDILKDNKPFHLLLSDVVLPDGSGVDLADELKNSFPAMAVLLMSGYVDKRVREEEIKKRGYAYFRKPFKISMLLSVIANALEENPLAR